MNNIELCAYCLPETPLTECTSPVHWDRRLKSCNLGENKGKQPQIESRGQNGQRLITDRLVPITGKHTELPGAYIPEGLLSPELEDSFRLETNPQAQAQFAARTRTKDTTYADINIYERCASPRYRRTA